MRLRAHPPNRVTRPVIGALASRRVGFLFQSLGGYQRSWLRGDLIAGLTVWAVLVPEALAYASIAGVSPVVGLYAAPGALILYAALGSSRQLVVGPMAATAALSAATIAALVPVGGGRFAALTAGLAITTGLTALLAGVLRLGFLASFISEPVLKGFIVGLALTIIVGQVPKLLGIKKGSGDFFAQLWHVITHLGDVQGLTLLVGLLSLAVIFGLRRFAPAIPGSLVAVLLGIAAVKVFNLDHHGVEIVGPIKSGLPSFGIPKVHAGDVGALVAGGVGVMLVGFAEGLGAAKTYAAREHQQIDANRELLGLGGANLASALSSGMVVNGSLSKTAVNASAGARSQLSGLIVAALTVITLLVLTGLFENLPEATLSAVVIAAVIELVDVPGLIKLYRAYSQRLGREFGFVARPDFIAAIAAMLGVTVFDTLPGLFIGITVSLLLLIYRASRPYVATLGKTAGREGHYRDVDRHPDAQIPDHVVVLRIESGLYFANADAVRARILQAASVDGIRAVVLDAETVPFIDVTSSRMLADLSEELQHQHVRLLIARDVGQVRDVLHHVVDDPTLQRFYPTVQTAVDAVEEPDRHRFRRRRTPSPPPSQT
jgi:sulfate permease, SulP family